MQSPNIKYFQGRNQDLYLFFHEASTLYYKILTPGGWSQPQILAERTGPMFSVAYYDNETYVLYSTLNGVLMLAKTSDFNRWEQRQLMAEKKDLSRTKFLMSPDQNAFHMIYHLPTENTGVHSLIYASFRNGQWENSYQVDRFLPFSGEPYLTGRVNHNHIILYYRTARNVISAREMLLYPYTMGSVNPIIQTPYPCIDLSVINDTERIHLLYIVKGMFRCQVVYQYKQSASISTPRVIWEEASCEHCLIFQENGKLKLFWTSNGQPYFSVSENNGGSFLAVEKYTAPFPRNVIKGQFIQANPSAASIQATQAFGDGRGGYAMAVFMPNNGLQPQIEMPLQAASNARPSIQDIQGVSDMQNFNDMSNQSLFINSQTHQNNIPQNALLDAQQQIDELSRLLAQRSEEITEVNARWKEQTLRLEQEAAQLQQAIYTHQQENQELRDTIEAMEQRLYAAESHTEEQQTTVSEE